MEIIFNNNCCEITHLTQFLKNKLYFATILGRPPKTTSDTVFFSIDDELVYHNYYSDFGPLNLSCLYRYCNILNNKLKTTNGKKVIHYTSNDPNKRANAAFLISAFAVLYLAQSPNEAFYTAKYKGKNFKPFQDASQKESIYHITILDCLQALHRAVTLRLFNFMDFDCAEYDKLNKVAFGDMTWIVPNKFIAFPGPVESASQEQSPELYIKYFLKNNVTAVIRLNKPQYDSQKFTNAGIKHFELFFPDGSTPPRHVLTEFLQISENEPGAIAIHCKAGLGRTGTLIAAYLIKHYDMGARESIAWLRLCRPGSVIGPQQAYLEQAEGWLWKEGFNYRMMTYGEAEKLPCHRFGIYSILQKKRVFVRPDDATLHGILQEKRQFLNQISNDIINNRTMQNCTTAEIIDKSEQFQDVQNENMPMKHSAKQVITSHQNIEFPQNFIRHTFNERTDQVVKPNPIIVMPAMFSVKQKQTMSSPSRYINNLNQMNNNNLHLEDGKYKALVKKQTQLTKDPLNNIGINYFSPSAELSQGQRLVDLKKDREQFFKNKGIQDIRLLSQGAVVQRQKKAK